MSACVYVFIFVVCHINAISFDGSIPSLPSFVCPIPISSLSPLPFFISHFRFILLSSSSLPLFLLPINLCPSLLPLSFSPSPFILLSSHTLTLTSSLLFSSPLLSQTTTHTFFPYYTQTQHTFSFAHTHTAQPNIQPHIYISHTHPSSPSSSSRSLFPQLLPLLLPAPPFPSHLLASLLPSSTRSLDPLECSSIPYTLFKIPPPPSILARTTTTRHRPLKSPALSHPLN